MIPLTHNVSFIPTVSKVHMKNQEVHKNLRHNKPGVRLNEIEEPPSDYVRPEGFNMVQPIMQYRSGNQVDGEETIKYYRDLKDEMSR